MRSLENSLGGRTSQPSLDQSGSVLGDALGFRPMQSFVKSKS